MNEIRIHGRGGQGAVVCAQILANTLFKEGFHVQAFPSFGMERRGAPVSAFVRSDNKPIRLRSEVYEPDMIIVLDPSLFEAIQPTSGLKPGGVVLINSDRPSAKWSLGEGFAVHTVNASQIAVQNHLGTATMPIVNTAIAGAFAAITGMAKIDSVASAIQEIVPSRTKENVNAARQAYYAVKV